VARKPVSRRFLPPLRPPGPVTPRSCLAGGSLAEGKAEARRDYQLGANLMGVVIVTPT